MNRYIIGITDYECAASQRGVTVHQNNTNTVREVFADEENFRHTKLMVFGPEGSACKQGRHKRQPSDFREDSVWRISCVIRRKG